jgi:hypothetical protein
MGRVDPGRGTTHLVCVLGVEIVLDRNMALFAEIRGGNLYKIGDFGLNV